MITLWLSIVFFVGCVNGSALVEVVSAQALVEVQDVILRVAKRYIHEPFDVLEQRCWLKVAET